MKGLGRVFQAKGLARPRPEVGKRLSGSRNRKAASVNSIWAEGRMMEESLDRWGQGEKWGLSSKESHRGVLSRE